MNDNRRRIRIRVDDDVWRVIQDASTPMTDTPNSTLRRLLKIDMPPSANFTRLPEMTFYNMDVGDIRTFRPAVGETFGGLQGRIAAAAHRFSQKTRHNFTTTGRHPRYPGKIVLKRVS